MKSLVALDLLPPAVVASPKLTWTIADVRDPGLERHFEGADAIIHLAPITGRIFERTAQVRASAIVHMPVETEPEASSRNVKLRPGLLFGRRMSRSTTDAIWNGTIKFGLVKEGGRWINPSWHLHEGR